MLNLLLQSRRHLREGVDRVWPKICLQSRNADKILLSKSGTLR